MSRYIASVPGGHCSLASPSNYAKCTVLYSGGNRTRPKKRSLPLRFLDRQLGRGGSQRIGHWCPLYLSLHCVIYCLFPSAFSSEVLGGIRCQLVRRWLATTRPRHLLPILLVTRRHFDATRWQCGGRNGLSFCRIICTLPNAFPDAPL
jgi:hypothetical protein